MISPFEVSPRLAKKIGASRDESKDKQQKALSLIDRQTYLDNALKRKGAIAAVDRIMRNGCTEKKLPLQDLPYFRDQLRLTADMRLRRVLTTGASQVSKTLANVNVLADCLIYGQIDAGYFFDSRDNLFNNQPQQIQPVLDHYIAQMQSPHEVGRAMIARFSYGLANGYFFYVTGDNKESSGGAAESSKVASVSIAIAWCEEYSSWGNVDITPRLGASALLSKPLRMLGTPGGGNSPIDKDLDAADHPFYPGLNCPHCGELTYLDVFGALLRPIKDERTGTPKYFNARGEILGYWSKDNTPETAFVACLHCNGALSPSDIKAARLRDRKTGKTADDFLDELPEDKVCGKTVAIMLSPLLRVPTDPLRVEALIREGLDPENPLIYMQNKLGIVSQVGTFGISITDFADASTGHPFNVGSQVCTVAGVDQGRESHWITILQFSRDNPSQLNVILGDSCGQEELISLLDYHKVDFCLIDNEPDRLAARDLSLNGSNTLEQWHPITRLLQDLYGDYSINGSRLLMADQKTFETDIKANKVSHGEIVMPCLDIATSLFIDKLVAAYTERNIRVTGKVHRKFQRHMTSVKRNLDSGKWQRPANHDDDLFFASMFAIAARDFFVRATTATNQSATPIVGGKIKTVNW